MNRMDRPGPGRLTALGREVSRLARRTRQQLAEGGPPRVARGALMKLGVYAGFQRQRLLADDTFDVGGISYCYFRHPYNATWRNERAVEIPLARAFVDRHRGEGLEVGNVLSHYGPVDHAIVDRDEAGTGVVNIDVLDLVAPEGFDYIVAISTIEHVGWDDRPRDGQRATLALAHLRRLLRPEGQLFVSCPLGHNPVLDEWILARPPGEVAASEWFLRRSRRGNRYAMVDEAQAQQVASKGGVTQVVWVAEFGPAEASPNCVIRVRQQRYNWRR